MERQYTSQQQDSPSRFYLTQSLQSPPFLHSVGSPNSQQSPASFLPRHSQLSNLVRYQTNPKQLRKIDGNPKKLTMTSQSTKYSSINSQKDLKKSMSQLALRKTQQIYSSGSTTHLQVRQKINSVQQQKAETLKRPLHTRKGFDTKKHIINKAQSLMRETKYVEAYEYMYSNQVLFKQEFQKAKTVCFYQVMTLCSLYLSIMLINSSSGQRTQSVGALFTYQKKYLDFLISHIMYRNSSSQQTVAVELKLEKVMLDKVLSVLYLLLIVFYREGRTDDFLGQSQQTFSELKGLQKSMIAGMKQQYIWLKNSLLLDYITYRLVQCPIDQLKTVQQDVSLVVNSIRKTLGKNGKVDTTYQLKLKVTLESAVFLYIQIENGTLTYDKILQALHKRLQKDILEAPTTLSESDQKQLETIITNMQTIKTKPSGQINNKGYSSLKPVDKDETTSEKQDQVENIALFQQFKSTMGDQALRRRSSYSAANLSMNTFPAQNYEQMQNDLSKVIRVNELKELPLDDQKISMDGCFEAQIVNFLKLNRGGLNEIRKRPKPKYAPFSKVKEELIDFKKYFKMKKDMQDGNFYRKTIGTFEDLKALAFKKMQRKEERQALKETQMDQACKSRQNQVQENKDCSDLNSSIQTDNFGASRRSSPQNQSPASHARSFTLLAQFTHQKHFSVSPKVRQDSSSKMELIDQEMFSNHRRSKTKDDFQIFPLPFNRRAGQSDLGFVKKLQKVLLENMSKQKSMIRKQSIIRNQTQAGGTNSQPQNFSDLLNDSNEKQNLLTVQEQMKKHLKGIFDDNQQRYWGTLMKLNQDNQAFRFAFSEYIEESEQDYQVRRSKELKKKILAQKQAKIWNKLMFLKQAGLEDNGQQRQEANRLMDIQQLQEASSLRQPDTNNNSPQKQQTGEKPLTPLAHKKRFSIIHYIRQIREAKRMREEEAKRGLSKKRMLQLRDKVHREDIENILQEKKDDLDDQQKEYLKSKNIIDWEEVKDKQSKMQRRNLAKILKNRQGAIPKFQCP